MTLSPLERRTCRHPCLRWNAGSRALRSRRGVTLEQPLNNRQILEVDAPEGGQTFVQNRAQKVNTRGVLVLKSRPRLENLRSPR